MKKYYRSLTYTNCYCCTPFEVSNEWLEITKEEFEELTTPKDEAPEEENNEV